MNNANQNPVEQVAVDFVETELQQARASLRRSRFFAAGSVLFVVAYMSFLTVTLKTKLLEQIGRAHV